MCTCESIDHDAGNYVREEQPEEHGEAHVKEELYRVPLRHGVADHTGRHQSDHAGYQRVAHVRLLTNFRVDVIEIGVKCENRKAVNEKHAKQSDNEELFGIVAYRLEDVLEEREAALGRR